MDGSAAVTEPAVKFIININYLNQNTSIHGDLRIRNYFPTDNRSGSKVSSPLVTHWRELHCNCARPTFI